MRALYLDSKDGAAECRCTFDRVSSDPRHVAPASRRRRGDRGRSRRAHGPRGAHVARARREVRGAHRGHRSRGADAPVDRRAEPRRAGDRRSARRRASRARATRPPARHSRPRERQHRHGRPDADDSRLARARGAPARRDADVVARLREAGAVVLGKTNLSEWANIRGARPTSASKACNRLSQEPPRARRELWLQLRLGRGGRGEPGHARPGHRDGRLDRPARRPSAGSWASSRQWASSAAPASSPSRARRTPPSPMARTVTDAALLLGAIARRTTRGPPRAPAGARGRASASWDSYPGVSPAVEALFEGRSRMRRLGAVLVDPVTIANARDAAGLGFGGSSCSSSRRGSRPTWRPAPSSPRAPSKIW